MPAVPDAPAEQSAEQPAEAAPAADEPEPAAQTQVAAVPSNAEAGIRVWLASETDAEKAMQLWAHDPGAVFRTCSARRSHR